MILNLKIIKGKDNYDIYNKIQQFQKYGKNYSFDMIFIVARYKGEYTWLEVWFYYKKKKRIVDSTFPPNIESKKKGSIYYSIEGDKIVLSEEAVILKYNFLEYYYYYSKPELELLLYMIEKEQNIPYFIYKPTLIYSIIAIQFTENILYGSAG
ncbi:MAG: hypothetical protein ABIL45_04405 [candidate division WOR-3 bacterium]